VVFSKGPIHTIRGLSKRIDEQPVTLRAWERRYDLLEPERLENNYRLYSERDFQVVRWITHRLDDGLSISTAAKEYKSLRGSGIWPEALPTVSVPEPSKKPLYQPEIYAEKIFDTLTSHDAISAKEYV